MAKQSFSPEPLPGAVLERWFRCGKPNCRCAAGERHGPYFVRSWRAGGRLHREYVPREQVEEVRAACALWRENRRQVREGRREWTRMMRELRSYQGLIRRMLQR